jgi:hypothetical protein
VGGAENYRRLECLTLYSFKRREAELWIGCEVLESGAAGGSLRMRIRRVIMRGQWNSALECKETATMRKMLSTVQCFDV